MSEITPFQVFDVEESGHANKLDIPMEELKFFLSPEKALIIVREDARRIYFWKGAKAAIRKRFLGSRLATKIQGDVMQQGGHRCKIITIDQGEELEEFLNIFGLESMEITERLEDVKILRDSERQQLEHEQLLTTKIEVNDSSKLDEINKLLDADEKIIWIKSYIGRLKKNWIKNMLKDKRYKNRVKHLDKAEGFELKEYDNRYVITNKRIIVHSIFNQLYDFSAIPERYFKINGEIASLNLEGIDSFEVELNRNSYDVWINADPIKVGQAIFIFEELTEIEYEKFLDIFRSIVHYRAEIPEDIKLRYIKRTTQ